MKSTMGKVSAVMILLTFMLASTFVLNIALAQNETNVSEDVTVVVDNGTTSWDFVEGNLLNETAAVTNETSNETFLTNLSETSVNETSNETVVINENATNETNITSDEEPSIEPSFEPLPVEPKFDVKLIYPQRITRGEAIRIRADVASDSFAKNVYLRWNLPQGMEIISGNHIEACGDLDAEISCSSEIDVRTYLSVLGLNEIKVVISYEK